MNRFEKVLLDIDSYITARKIKKAGFVEGFINVDDLHAKNVYYLARWIRFEQSRLEKLYGFKLRSKLRDCSVKYEGDDFAIGRITIRYKFYVK